MTYKNLSSTLNLKRINVLFFYWNLGKSKHKQTKRYSKVLLCSHFVSAISHFCINKTSNLREIQKGKKKKTDKAHDAQLLASNWVYVSYMFTETL